MPHVYKENAVIKTDLTDMRPTTAQTMISGAFFSVRLFNSFAKHSLISLANNFGASHAGISTAFWCRLTQTIGQDTAPHINGVEVLLRKLLTPRGTLQ